MRKAQHFLSADSHAYPQCQYGKKPTGSGYQPTRVSATQEDHWPELILLAEYDLPEFPVDALPEALRDYVQDVAASIQVPDDLPAMLSLAAISVAAGGKYQVQAKPDWIEQVNLYLAVVMASATRKSKCFSLMTEPIQEYERELCERLRNEIEQCQSDYRVLEDKRKRLERDISKGDGDEMELVEVNQQIANFQMIHEPTLIASDVTVEVVSRLLCQNNGRLGILSAEGGIFAVFAGRYSDNKPVNDVFLKAHDGDMHKVHRVGRESEYIERPALTITEPLALCNSKKKETLKGPTQSSEGAITKFLVRNSPDGKSNSFVRSECSDMLAHLTDCPTSYVPISSPFLFLGGQKGASKAKKEGVPQTKLPEAVLTVVRPGTRVTRELQGVTDPI